jgi:hypothetical protein
MTEWPVLDVALGLTLVYASVSLLCSSLNEAFASILGLRAKFLEKWLRRVLSNPAGPQDAAEAALAIFYGHPLIQPMVGAPLPRTTSPRRPSYIPASTFVSALLNPTPGAGAAPTSLKSLVASLPSSPAKDVVVAIYEEVGEDAAQLRKRLEAWYDQSMDRVSGWYKRRVQVVVAVIGLIAASGLNIDSVHIADTLWSQPSVRSAVVAEAKNVAAHTSPPTSDDLVKAANNVNALSKLKIPIGWQLKKNDARDLPRSFRAVVFKIVGILITTLALLLGAPFWFDLLGKLVSLRGAGPTPATPAPVTAGAPPGAPPGAPGPTPAPPGAG